MKQLSRRQAITGGAGLGLAACRTEAGTTTSSAGASSRPGSAREVLRVFDASPTRDGAGVRLSRAIGGRPLPMLDPFLLLDEFHSDDPNDYAAGFPSHPHRGFETVTYMLEGAME